MKKWFFLFVLFFTVSKAFSFSTNGIKTFDLKSWDHQGTKTFSLNGKWSFLWGKLVDPKDFLREGLKPYKEAFGSIPGRWVNYKGLSLKNNFGKCHICRHSQKPTSSPNPFF